MWLFCLHAPPDKFDIVPVTSVCLRFIPTQIKFLATPLCRPYPYVNGRVGRTEHGTRKETERRIGSLKVPLPLRNQFQFCLRLLDWFWK